MGKLSRLTYSELILEIVDLGHPDLGSLLAAVQQEYVRRYGGPDETPLDASEFRAPEGVVLVAKADGIPVGMGAWRSRGANPLGLRDGDAEIKRMFVVPEAQRQGIARAVLAELESIAASAGRSRMVLETGALQPEAIALYESSGYRRIPNFGFYSHAEHSQCFAKPIG